MVRHLALLMLAACGRVGFEGVDLAVDAATDATRDATPDLCAGLLCDSFDDPSLAAWPISELVGPGSIDHDATFGRSGGSLHGLGQVPTEILARGAEVFPPTATELWVRMWIYIPSGFTLDIEPVELTSPAHDYQIVFGLYDDGMTIHAHDVADDFELATSIDVPVRNAWACYEFGVSIGASGEVQLYVDGNRVLDDADVDTRPPVEPFTQVRIGIASKPATSRGELWIDDVQTNTARPGCE